MAEGLSEIYQDLLTGSYDCVDRIVLNGYYRMGHEPAGFRTWWRRLTGSDETLDNHHLMRLAGRFSRRVQRLCQGPPDSRDRLRRRRTEARYCRRALENNHREAGTVPHPGGPGAGARVGCGEELSHRGEEADAVCKPLFVPPSWMRMGGTSPSKSAVILHF